MRVEGKPREEAGRGRAERTARAEGEGRPEGRRGREERHRRARPRPEGEDQRPAAEGKEREGDEGLPPSPRGAGEERAGDRDEGRRQHRHGPQAGLPAAEEGEDAPAKGQVGVRDHRARGAAVERERDRAPDRPRGRRVEGRLGLVGDVAPETGREILREGPSSRDAEEGDEGEGRDGEAPRAGSGRLPFPLPRRPLLRPPQESDEGDGRGGGHREVPDPEEGDPRERDRVEREEDLEPVPLREEEEHLDRGPCPERHFRGVPRGQAHLSQAFARRLRRRP